MALDGRWSATASPPYRIGQLVLFKEDINTFTPAVILEVNDAQPDKYLLQYVGWRRQWNTWEPGSSLGSRKPGSTKHKNTWRLLRATRGIIGAIERARRADTFAISDWVDVKREGIPGFGRVSGIGRVLDKCFRPVVDEENKFELRYYIQFALKKNKDWDDWIRGEEIVGKVEPPEKTKGGRGEVFNSDSQRDSTEIEDLEDLEQLRAHCAALETGNYPKHAVERVLNRRKTEDGDFEYKVRWARTTSDDDSWEPAAKMANAKEQIDAFAIQRKEEKRKQKALLKQQAFLQAQREAIADTSTKRSSTESCSSAPPQAKRARVGETETISRVTTAVSPPKRAKVAMAEDLVPADRAANAAAREGPAPNVSRATTAARVALGEPKQNPASKTSEQTVQHSNGAPSTAATSKPRGGFSLLSRLDSATKLPGAVQNRQSPRDVASAGAPATKSKAAALSSGSSSCSSSSSSASTGGRGSLAGTRPVQSSIAGGLVMPTGSSQSTDSATSSRSEKDHLSLPRPSAVVTPVTSPTNSEDRPSPVAAEIIRVKVRSGMDGEKDITFKIKMDTHLSKVMDAYTSKMQNKAVKGQGILAGKAGASLHFTFDGIVIKREDPSHTAHGLDMEDDDMIDVRLATVHPPRSRLPASAPTASAITSLPNPVAIDLSSQEDAADAPQNLRPDFSPPQHLGNNTSAATATREWPIPDTMQLDVKHGPNSWRQLGHLAVSRQSTSLPSLRMFAPDCLTVDNSGDFVMEFGELKELPYLVLRARSDDVRTKVSIKTTL